MSCREVRLEGHIVQAGFGELMGQENLKTDGDRGWTVFIMKMHSIPLELV